jgi:hypothetical protein
MAVLSNERRREVFQSLMSDWSRDRKPIPFTKDVILSAIGGADQWFEDQEASSRNALPEKITALLPDEQVEELMSAVQRARQSDKEGRKRVVR